MFSYNLVPARPTHFIHVSALLAGRQAGSGRVGFGSQIGKMQMAFLPNEKKEKEIKINKARPPCSGNSYLPSDPCSCHISLALEVIKHGSVIVAPLTQTEISPE